jgi:autotransporter-associated beta strand protein/T5SS/PEP-CTERM-associated repeat protein
MARVARRRVGRSVVQRIEFLRAALPAASAFFAFMGAFAPVDARAANVDIDNGTTLVVQSPTPLTADLLIVGDQHSGQALTVQNAGQVSAISTIAGLGTSGNFSNNNFVTVTGAGSLLQNIDPLQTFTGATLIVGNFGTGNRLTVSGGGHVTMSHVSGLSGPDDVVVGYQLGANSNTIAVTGAGSQMSSIDSTLYIGLNSSHNEMDILNGGLVSSKNVRIGGGTGGSVSADSNVVLVDGAVSAWNISGTLRVGSNGTNSTLTISNGGTVQVTGNTFLGYDASSTGNRITVTGAHSQLSAVDVTIGRLGDHNTILVEDGGAFTANSITLANTGKLQIGSGAGAGTVGVTTNITGDSTSSVVFGHNQSNYVFGSIIAGALNVVQGGTGETILSGANAYTGTTIVSGGMLVVTGSSLSSGYTVAGGTLAGTATLSAVAVGNSATLEPGNPGVAGGTLRISGNLVMASAASYLVNVAPTAASLTAIGGSATLAGTFDAVGTGGAYTQGHKYTVLTSTGTRSGAFSSLAVSGSFGSMMPTLSYDAHDVFLTLVPGNLAANLPAGAPQNDVNLANAITAANTGTPPLAFQNLFQLSPSQLANALTQLSGEAATGAPGASFGLISSFLSLLTGSPGGGTGAPALPFAPERADAFPPDVALAYASVLKARLKAPSPSWNAWGAAFGGSTRTSGDPSGAGSHDVTARAGAFAAGIDYRVSPDTVVGFALAGGGAGWDLSAGLGGGRSDTFMAGLRAFTRRGQAYLSGGLSYASSWISTSRTLTVGPDTLSASFNAQSLGGRLEGGYRIPSALAFAATPYAGVQVQSFRSPAYSESGALGAPDPLGLSYASQTATAVRTELGSRFDRGFVQRDGNLDLFGRVAWAHDWQSNPNLTATFIGLPAASFVVNGAAPPADLVLLTAGAEWRRRDGWAFLAKLDGELAGRAQTYMGTARVKYSW